MQHSILTWETMHEFGGLYFRHLQLRKSLFVDKMRWTLCHSQNAEWDQYDTPETRYVITHHEEKVLAASRLLPCSFRHGRWSYMIRDASLGLIDGIPKTVIDVVPAGDDVWEATRFTVDPGLPAEDRNRVLVGNAHALHDAAAQLGATELIALMPPAYIRWLSSIGLKTRRLGRTHRDEQDKTFCAMAMTVS